jgi:hypothetical protein
MLKMKEEYDWNLESCSSHLLLPGVTATDIEFAVDPILVSSLDTAGRACHILLS